MSAIEFCSHNRNRRLCDECSRTPAVNTPGELAPIPRENAPTLSITRASGRELDIKYANCQPIDFLTMIGELIVWFCRAQPQPVESFDDWMSTVRRRVEDPRVGMDS